ncbi:MAG: GHKL domain-containing protein, partial [Chryseobacterium sp.]|uniref:sensor histidine kinase n=1 Tax=Chryseobacterium sp. TaxID=1871047 RepID=UPI002FC59960
MTIGLGILVVGYIIIVIGILKQIPAVDLVLISLFIILPAFFFKNPIGNTIGIGVCMKSSFLLFHNLAIGISHLILNGYVASLDWVFLYNLTQIIFTMLFCVIGYFLYKKNVKLCEYVKNINGLFCIPFAICIFVLRLEAGFSGPLADNLVKIILGWSMIKNGVFGIFVILICILLIALVSQKRTMKRLLLLNQKCIDEQTKQYQMLDSRDREIRKFKHDYNEHMVVIHRMIEEETYDQLKTYVKGLGNINDTFHFISTNNIICDAILNQYEQMGAKEGIKLSALGKLPPKANISETDLCVIVSNGIRNAYEATQKCQGDNREIFVCISNHAPYLYIDIKNPVAEEMVFDGKTVKTTKPDKNAHGFGMENMLQTAEKNRGTIQWCDD